MDKFNKYLIIEADIENWKMHSACKKVQVSGKSEYDNRELNKLLEPNTEFIVVRDYSDVEYEYFILTNIDGCYYFILDVGTVQSK